MGVPSDLSAHEDGLVFGAAATGRPASSKTPAACKAVEDFGIAPAASGADELVHGDEWHGEVLGRLESGDRLQHLVGVEVVQRRLGRLLWRG